jgi:hypothetical protein
VAPKKGVASVRPNRSPQVAASPWISWIRVNDRSSFRMRPCAEPVAIAPPTGFDRETVKPSSASSSRSPETRRAI